MDSDLQTYDHSVFINCPFDIAYKPLFQSAVFAVVDCGFIPRTALDVSDASEVRIHKIYSIIGSSRLSIHDLSRTQLDPDTKLPRFNMPLELGIFLGAKFLGDSQQRRKACLVFDEKPYRYQTYLSDVAGQDISWHANDPKTLILRVRDWLAHLSGEPLPSGSLIYDHYRTFQGELRHSCEILRQKPDELTYPDFLHHVKTFKKKYVEVLEVDNKKKIKNPRSGDVKRQIRDIEEETGSVIVLVKGATALTYLQAFGSANEGWTVEYQDGHLDAHYQAADALDSESLIRAFQYYIEGEEEWKAERRWLRLDIA